MKEPISRTTTSAISEVISRVDLLCYDLNLSCTDYSALFDKFQELSNTWNESGQGETRSDIDPLINSVGYLLEELEEPMNKINKILPILKILGNAKLTID